MHDATLAFEKHHTVTTNKDMVTLLAEVVTLAYHRVEAM